MSYYILHLHYSLLIVCHQVDHFACGGIDQLTEKVPQLKDATPKLIEETKVIAKEVIKVVATLTFLCFRVQ